MQTSPRRPVPTYRDLLDRDSRAVRATLRERSDAPGSSRVPSEVFHSPQVHRLEIERLWGRAWQVACLEQDVPAPGDFLEYEIAGRSILVVREAAGRLRAFHNVCRHRGTKLKVGTGTASDLRCAFHAWCWTLDGRLKDVPCREDFPSLVEEETGLVPVRVATWKGFVFVSLDPSAPPLEEFLGETVVRHFEDWPIERRWKAIHVARVMPCNWKLAIEAFMESYHIFRTHPQAIPYVADTSVQYDAYGLHGRFVTPTGAPSGHAHEEFSDQQIVDRMVGDVVADFFGDSAAAETPRVSAQGDARRALAEFLRGALGKRLGVDFAPASDAEMLDAIGYTIFPNVVVFLGEELPVIYRSRPHGDDPGRSLFEVMVHLPLPEGTPRPPATPMRLLPEGASWAEAPELGGLGPIFDQDTSNLDRMQPGQSSPGFPGPIFAERQEMLLRQLHRNLEEWLSRP